MINVERGIELWCHIPNTVGIVARITKAVSETKTNILATASWPSARSPEKGYFKMVTSDNPKAAEAIQKLGYQVNENDVLLLELSNEPAAFHPVAQKIADAGINIDYHYVTAIGQKAIVVLATNDNIKAIEAIR